MCSISDLIKRAKAGDQKSMESLLQKFSPIINSLSWKLKSEYGKTDLTIFFIKMIYGFNLRRLSNSSDGALVNYIKKSLYYEYYRLNKPSQINEVELTDNLTQYTDEYEKVEYEILLDDLIKKEVITEKQKYVLLNKYYYDHTDEELAKKLCVSRQAINKMHNLSIRHLKKYLN